MSAIRIEQINQATLRITSDDFGIEQELCEHFKFRPDGYQFTPSFKNKVWDGWVRKYDVYRKTLPYGLLSYVENFAQKNDYPVENLVPKTHEAPAREEVEQFIAGLNLHSGGKKIALRDYQVEAVYQAIARGRMIALSPTSSGKSAIIYCYIRWMLQSGERVLLCVPTTMLVTQMFKDFEDYSSHNGWDVEQFAHTLHAGREKIFTKPVLISTWQSIHALTKTKNKATQEFMASWTVYIGDEAHRFASASLMQISDRLVNAKFRLGTTGTLKDSKVDKLTLEGSFGAVFKVTTTKDLMDAGQVVKLKIKCLMLQYPAEVKKAMCGIDYKAELDWLVTNPKRNRFIANLTRAIPGVTLVLFQLVEKQGKALYETIKKQCGDTRPVFYISGKVSPKEREEIRAALMINPTAILVASYQTLSTGVNAPGIENVVFASPMKSRITNLQSIGRGLRLREGKSSCTLYDISDNLAHKSKLNHTLRHFKERIETYQSEGFEFNVTEVAL